jgi:hypothetical protein
MTRTTSAATLTACAAALTLAACGGSDPSPADAQAKAEQAQLKFARCMRSHGVNVPDPKPGAGDGPGLVRIGGPGKDGISPQVFRRADAACRKYLQAAAPKLSPAQQAELRDQALKFARCMRQHGVDIPDPETSGGGFRITQRSSAGAGARTKSFTPDSPAFKDAQEACKAFEPKRILSK